MQRKPTIVMVGNEGVGKISLIRRMGSTDVFKDHAEEVLLKDNGYLTFYISPCSDDFVMVNINEVIHEIVIRIAPADPKYDALRLLMFDLADCFLLCYAVDDEESLEDVKKVWMTELRKRNKSQKVPIVLCATKIDQREAIENCLTCEQGKIVAEQIGAKIFVECSAKTNEGVLRLVMETAKMMIQQRNQEAEKKRGRCIVV